MIGWLQRRIRQNEAIFSAAREARDLKSLAQGLKRGTFSQHGEDVFIRSLLAGQQQGFYVDIGASHPFRISNTYMLYRMGWSGVTVEPIPALARLHKRWRPRDTLVQAAIGPEAGELQFFEMFPSVLSTLDPVTAEKYVAEGKAEVLRKYPIKVVTPMQLFEEYAAGRTIDLLSIDIEGLDVRTIREIDFSRVRPRLLCIELNDAADTAALDAHLAAQDYQQIALMGCNLIAASRESGLSAPKRSAMAGST